MKLKKYTPPAGPTPKERVIKRVKITALVLLGIFAFLIAADLLYSGISVYRWTHPEKITWSQSPAEFGLDYYSFEIETENGTVRGWKIAAQTPIPDDAEEWVPATEYSDKTVVLACNYDSNREFADLGGIDYMVDLCSAGYNVITFDWTGSGFSDGAKNVFLLDKVEDLRKVVEFAASETESSFLAIHAVGFACYPATQVAADCDVVDALVLDSSYESFSDAFYGNFKSWSAVSFAPVRETVRMMFPMIAGFSPDEYALTDAMNRMNQKAVLFIQGEYDEVFGSDGAKHLQSLAKNDNESSLWIVPEATHLRCRTYDIEQYLSKVDSFLDEIYDSSHAA